MVLHQPTDNDGWWSDSVKEYLKVSPECFQLGNADEIKEMHRLTAGLFRSLQELLLQAYRESVQSGRAIVTMSEVRLAYGSRAFSAHRKDIEDLASLAVSRVMEQRRPDLVCAFVERTVVPAGTSTTKKITPAAQAYPFDVSAALIESTVSAQANVALRALRKSANSPSDQQKAKVLRMPKRTSVSAQSLMDGAQLLRQALDKPRSSPKKMQTTSETMESKDENAS
jgi:hypothetical protein